MRRFRIGCLIVLALGMFVLLVGARDITTSHEARVALVARGMAESGWPWSARPVATPRYVERDVIFKDVGELPTSDVIDVNPWLVPLFSGQIRLQKPPVPYWCAAVAMRLVGRSEWAVRLVPGLLGAACVFLLFDLTRRLYGRRMAWFAALAFASTHFVVTEFRKAMADPFLAFFTLLCLWAWAAATSRPAEPSDRRRRTGWILLFYMAMGLGLLSKGPPLWAHLAIAIGAFHLCFRRALPRPLWAHAAGVALMLAIALPWPWYVLRHVPGALDIWHYESIGELTENTRNAREWYFYLPMAFVVALPWVGLWALGFAAALRRRSTNVRRSQGFPVVVGPSETFPPPPPPVSAPSRRRQWRELFPLLWYVITVAFFSFVNLKKNAYLLPMMPAQALLVAQGGVLLIAWSKRWRDRAGVIATAQIGLGIGFAVWLGYQMIFGRFPQPLPWGIPLTALGLAVTVIPWLMVRRHQWARWFAWQAVAYAVLVSLMTTFYQAAKDHKDSPQQFVSTIAALANHPGCVVYRNLPPDVLFYLPDGLPPYDPAAPCILAAVLEPNQNDPPRPPNSFGHVGAANPVTSARRVGRSPRYKLTLYELTTEARPPTTRDTHP